MPTSRPPSGTTSIRRSDLLTLKRRPAPEEFLDVSENNYRSLAKQSPNIIFISKTNDFSITEANDSAWEFCGYSQGELVNLDIFDLEMDPPFRQELWFVGSTLFPSIVLNLTECVRYLDPSGLQ